MQPIMTNPNFQAGLHFGKRLASKDQGKARELARQQNNGELAPATVLEADFDIGMFCGVVQTIGLRDRRLPGRSAAR